MAEEKRTPLFAHHQGLGAKIVDFHGWAMPVQYEGIIAEHKAVRGRAGVFDVSHMGQLEVTGSDALAFLQYLVPNDIAKLDLGQACYTQLCRTDGGTLDDLLVYRLSGAYLLVVNAGTTERDADWVRQHADDFPDAQVRNASEDYAMLAIQGPEAEATLAPHVEADLSTLASFRAREMDDGHARALVLSRTGYTGEDGFEVFGAPDAITALWEALLENGASPIGLGARDTLRLEAGLPLYGHELDEETTPVEARLGFSVTDKAVDYLGKEVLLRQKQEGGRKTLVGFRMIDGGVPRQGHTLRREGTEAGVVTSGAKSPTLDAFLGMGYLEGSERPDVGAEIAVAMRGRERRAEIAKLPFYRR